MKHDSQEKRLPLWQDLKQAFVFEESKVGNHLKSDFHQGIESYNHKLARFCLIVAFIIFVFASFNLSHFPKESGFISIISHFAIIAIAVTTLFVDSIAKIPLKEIVIVEKMTLAIGHAIYAISQNADIISSAKTETAFTSFFGFMTFLQILLIPNQNKAWKWLALFYTSCLFASGLLSTDSVFAVTNGAVFVFCGIFCKMIYATHIKNQVYLNCTLSEMEREKIRIEMDYARKIQDSFTIPSHQIESNDFHISTMQQKHELVGGDWASIRKDDNDKIFLLIADVTGKGMQAALIVHAIQSLWADSLSAKTFSPENFLRRVNNALLIMGQMGRHTSTMGILEISGLDFAYYSAGHPPVFKVSSNGEVKSFSSRGCILGMHADFRVSPNRFAISPEEECIFLLGTDGIFPKGTFTKRKFCINLVSTVDDQGSLPVFDHEVEDDKTLITVDRRRIANRKLLKIVS